MKTRKEWRDAERQRIAHLEIGRLVNIGTGALTALLDDADELARLRERIRCEIAVFQQYDLTDEANRLMTQLLDNGDGDAQKN